MVLIGIFLLLFGAFFCALGYLIVFQRKYALINNFVDDKHRGKFDDTYAKRNGLINLFWGLVSLILGIISLCSSSVTFKWIALVIVIVGIAACQLCNMALSAKQQR